jgi:21S rRNA (GM2251-2'-O)-methyltransferase
VVLALDEVFDPQNFGALLRSSYFLGVDKVVVCAKNSAPLSPVVSKASSGAMENMIVYSTDNMMRFLDKSKDNGWQVIGTDLGERSKSLNQVAVEKPTIVVLGNEGHGLRTNIVRRCDVLVKIGQQIRPEAETHSELNTETEASVSLGSAAGKLSAMMVREAQPAKVNLSSLNVHIESEEEDTVDSLNVSVTGGIILHHLLTNRK